MAKKNKQKKKIQQITEKTSQCQITDKTEIVSPVENTPVIQTKGPAGTTILCDHVDPNLASKWPKVKIKVPPVFIHKPVKFEQHIKHIIQRGIKFYHPHFGKNFTRILCQTFDDHKYLIQYLDKKQLPYHTYGNPTKKKVKIVMKGIPKDTDLNSIKNELKASAVPVLRVHQMKTKEDRRDNTMLVLVVVPHDENGKNILKVIQLLGHKVVLDALRDKPKQCYRCQKWGHSQRYCHGQIKCVKCAGEHLSTKCVVNIVEPPKCANCSDDHTANYRNCLYAPGSELYNMFQSMKIPVPSFKPNELVTLDNYLELVDHIKEIKNASK